MFSVAITATASDDVLSKIADQNENAIQRCVNNINQSPDDGFDTSSRLYQVGVCYFCIGCDFIKDNGKIFQIGSLDDNAVKNLTLNENYHTAHKLITQAAGLGNSEAYYGLAVLNYITNLTENKKTKKQQSVNELMLFENKVINEKLSNEEAQQSIDKITRQIYEKSNKLDFSLEIHKYLLIAAKQGHIPAQFALSEVYFSGLGIAPDDLEAYAWAATAVAQNPPFGSMRRDEKAVNLDEMELNQAEAIAEQYMKNFTNIFDRSSVTVMR